MDVVQKFGLMFAAIVLFLLIMALVLFIAGRGGGRRSTAWQGWWFVIPALLLITVGLVYPALRTIYQSFFNSTGRTFVGVENYKDIFTDSAMRPVLVNTVIWVILTPVLATAIGMIYAVLVDKIRFEAVAKTLMFLPMAISLVGASIIWKFMYAYRDPNEAANQIGLLNQVLVWLHLPTVNFILEQPWNTFFLIVVLIWIQAGFAMTVLSASIKAIPADITEAAMLDGVSGFRMFRFITLPSIRPATIVVLTTISIATLKVFDIVKTMTDGNFNTSVLAYEYFSQSITYNEKGFGAALAVVLFVLVTPIVVYNVRQFRKAEAR